MPTGPRGPTADQQVESLAQWLRDAIIGPAHAGQAAVLWEDRGSQVLMDVASLRVRTAGQALVVAIDTETAEYGRAPLVVRLVFGGGRDPAALVAASDEVVHGDERIAARWGDLFRGVVWSAIVRLSEAHARERGMQARSISILGDHLRFAAAPPASVPALAAEHRKRMTARRRTDGGTTGSAVQ
jgi:hypothetical protein